ncbi:RagB/SusD family nutrient uptake outer membrane protein [Niabella hibiscisoli]|uniref:RagB/SusD family nutrient uptake outer membrane protein n=1 Tax=Niabella hibiscisoli TaxID=1825928 RepID=UPI001F0E243D|nr:RagB/SusD family nutrient uptake outer membrane protein [Niabella hibiscisoli]MCH5719652.1 RagB/SusD family nutrient uptake outer membrane protein [Niabella hibiscisoli]
MKRNVHNSHNDYINDNCSDSSSEEPIVSMKLKQTHYWVIAAVLISAALLCVGCNKNFLEKPNGGTFTVDTVFSTQINADMAVARMYNLCIPSWFPRDNGNEMPRPDMLTDAVYYIFPTYSWVGLSNNAAAYTTGNQTADGNVDRGGFGNHYSGIRQANIILKKIDDVSDASQSWKDQVKGQALFCRAFQHFELFRQYGGIPIVVEPLDGTKKLDVRRSAVKTVTDSIVSWCDQAARLLPATWGPADFGRITSVAAKALKARMLLYVASPLYNTPVSMTAEIAEARYGDGRDTVLAYPSYDKERWKIAADAAKEVIDAAIAAGGGIYQTGKAETTPRTDNFEGLGDYEATFNVNANKELILVNTAHMWISNNGWLFGKYLMSKVRMGGWAVKNNVPIEFAQLYEKRTVLNGQYL